MSSGEPRYSDDGRWWWDGQAWRPVVPVRPTPAPPSHLILSAVLAVALAGVLTVVAIFAALAFAGTRISLPRQGGGAQTGSSTASCASRALSQAGDAVHTGDKGCGGSERIGKLLSSIDCSGSAFTSSEWQTVPAPAASNSSSVACTLDSPPPRNSSDDESTRIETRGSEPADLVLIADIVPSTPALVVGMSARCAQQYCVTFGVRSDNRYQMSEKKTSDSDFVLLDQGTVDASPTLATRAPSRLVLWLHGNRFEAYLNGRQLGHGVTTGVVSASGTVLIYLEGLDGTSPSVVKVNSLKLFASG